MVWERPWASHGDRGLLQEGGAQTAAPQGLRRAGAVPAPDTPTCVGKHSSWREPGKGGVKASIEQGLPLLSLTQHPLIKVRVQLVWSHHCPWQTIP